MTVAFHAFRKPCTLFCIGFQDNALDERSQKCNNSNLILGRAKASLIEDDR